MSAELRPLPFLATAPPFAPLRAIQFHVFFVFSTHFQRNFYLIFWFLTQRERNFLNKKKKKKTQKKRLFNFSLSTRSDFMMVIKYFDKHSSHLSPEIFTNRKKKKRRKLEGEDFPNFLSFSLLFPLLGARINQTYTSRCSQQTQTK